MVWNSHSWGGCRTTSWGNLPEKEGITQVYKLYSQIFYLHLFKDTGPNIVFIFLMFNGIN